MTARSDRRRQRRGRVVRVAVIAIGAFIVVGHVGMTAARAKGLAPTSLRCPAPGTPYDAATSQAPLRHAPAALDAILHALQSRMTRPHWSSVGLGRDRVQVSLSPGSEHLADQLVKKYGDAVGVDIAGVEYVPRGCGTQPEPRACPDIVGDDPATAGLRLRLVAETPTITASQTGRAQLVVENVGPSVFVMDPGSELVGSLVTPGTTHVVGEFAGGLAGTGRVLQLDPGASGTVDVFYGAARCGGAPGRGSALRPGRYGLRVVLESEDVQHPTPKLLSPETLVRISK